MSFDKSDSRSTMLRMVPLPVPGRIFLEGPPLRGDQVLGGTRGEAAYYLIVTPIQSGSDVALIVNNGR